MTRRSRARRPLTFALFALPVAVLAALFFLDRRPVRATWLDAGDPAAGRGDGAELRADAGCLLFTGRAAIARAAAQGDFEAMDWSLAWTNLLEQELGVYAHLDVTELEPALERGLPPVVVLARSALAGLDADDVARLREEVRRGLVLVLEQPPALWRPLAGVSFQGPPRERSRTGASAPGLLGPGVLEALAPMPLPAGRLAPGGRPDEGCTTLLYMDDAPALVEREFGAGAVLSVAFDLGRLAVTLQQGAPSSPDYRLEKRWGFYDHVISTHDLVWDEAYLENDVPAADVIERAVLAAVRRHDVLPGWWAFPDAAPGLLLMTHDEDGYEARMCRALLEHEREVGARSTWFLIARPRVAESWSPDDVREFAADGALELHWNRLPMVSGVWKVEPVRRVHSLAAQSGHLGAALAAGGARPEGWLNRNHYLMWASLAEHRAGEAHYTRTFRTLAGAGVLLDSTYGPNRGGRGYLFGTGRPYRPLDVDGTRFALRELPFVSQEDWGGETEDWWRRLFEESRDRYHCAIACIFHPHLIVLEEEGARLWKSVYRLAAETGHPALDLRQYHEFLERRGASPLRHRRLADGTVAIEAEARGPGLALHLALRDGAGVLVDGEAARPIEIAVDGRREHLLPLAPGTHLVLVRP